MPMPLAGVQALDLTSGVAGPYCTKILADYGADVIKVEPPQRGDVSRQLDGAADDDATATAPLFLQLNTNKRSITLDITTDAGADVLKRLLRRVDLLVDDGALSTTAAGEGWSHEALSAANQRLVITSISPFGPDGPHADYRATELVLSALGGWSFPMGDPGRAPLQPGGPYISYVAGLWAATGTLTALFSAGLTGFGQEVHDLDARSGRRDHRGGHGAPLVHRRSARPLRGELGRRPDALSPTLRRRSCGADGWALPRSDLHLVRPADAVRGRSPQRC